MVDRIVSAVQVQGLTDMVIGMEVTSIYGDDLIYSLREDGKSGQYSSKIHVLNSKSKQVSKFKGPLQTYPRTTA